MPLPRLGSTVSWARLLSRFAAPPFGEAIGFVLSALGPWKTLPFSRRSAEESSTSTDSEIEILSAICSRGPLTELKQNAASLLGSLIVCVCCEPTGLSVGCHIPFV